MKSTSKLGRDGRFWGLVMIAPTIIGLMILNIIPFFQTIYMSFSKTKAFGAYQFCGLENYLEMFRNTEFWKANWNSIYFCILTVPVGVFLALIVAVLLNAKIKGKTAFRAIFFLPMVVAPAAVAMVWKWIFNAEYGILNQVLGANIRWLTNPKIGWNGRYIHTAVEQLCLPHATVPQIKQVTGLDAEHLAQAVRETVQTPEAKGEAKV